MHRRYRGRRVRHATHRPVEHFAELRGYKGIGYRRLNLNGLLQLTSPTVPIVQYGNPHFVVVRGLDHRGRVSVADPGFGNRTITVPEFRAAWKDGIAFVLMPSSWPLFINSAEPAAPPTHACAPW
jgi:ABC-type bacteriocin/lantibiotic exporter with double-glycine peptidase domain